MLAMIKATTILGTGLIAILLATVAHAGSIVVGAAPAGEPNVVAAKIIKYNFPMCKKVVGAQRKSDGSIKARCDRNDYLIFTVFNAKEGRTLELALNCSAAKKTLDIDC